MQFLIQDLYIYSQIQTRYQIFRNLENCTRQSDPAEFKYCTYLAVPTLIDIKSLILR